MHCQKCGSITLKEILTPNEKHYAKLVCSDCGAWIKWLPNPEGNYKDKCKELISVALFRFPKDDFVRSLSNQFNEKNFLSNKQYSSLEKKVNNE